MLNDSVLKVSPNGSFKVTQLCQSVAICEALKEDRHNWGNATETEPAFIVYLGCKKDEIAEKIRYLNQALGCYWCEIREPKYLKEFEAEIKIRGMIRHSTEERNGLDFLVWAENDFNYIEFDEYNYYTTGYQPRW
ncbi:hypothetical protein Sta7437_4907 (plasmid) [Stanieria cyanosphaera PCC 7437]|uniref:Uncharacterized protein n=1 Tax=Stanieria cyanosphaera (strain ATCC 29371 / PCC 7437) TaxID=111780 RepID=K9Y1X2_STAC7|nr:hypothetical protein [Stanieria cyanosphaera]AFZ38334.1 hypothetical protein Sta7437_4907 [Stanieria cyanosphaera PCC 7437]